MANASKVCLHVLNIIIAVIALGLCCTSIWFFVQVYQLTSLRNSNHYLLDYNVYWPQAIPWLFFIVGVCVLCATFCGISGAKKTSKGLLNVYVVSFSVIVILLIATAIISLVFADSKSTDDFIKRTVWDVFGESQNNVEVADAFGKIEKKLYCCGADSPRDYKSFKSQEFPQSCCDQFHFGWNYQTFIECDFANKLANERHGCSHVASQYSRIVIKILSGVSLFVALLGIISVIVAFTLSRSLRQKPRVHQYAAPSETESEKVLM